METEFKPRRVENPDYYKEDLDTKSEYSHDENYYKLKKQMVLKRFLTRLIVLLILVCLVIFFFIIRKRFMDKKIEPNVVETTVEESQPKKDQPIIEPESKNESSFLSNLSPVNDTKSKKPALNTGDFEGAVFYDGETMSFNLCATNEDLLVVKDSPLYNKFYYEYGKVKNTVPVYVKPIAVLKGHKVPVSYSQIGSTYTQGFYIENIVLIDANRKC